MGIILKEFENTRHVGIKRDKKNHHRFLIEYTTKNTDPKSKSDRKRYRSIFNAEQYHGKRESLNAAYNRRESLLNARKVGITTGNDLDARVDDYFELFVKNKINKTTNTNYTTVYKNHIQTHIGNRKVKDVTPDDITNILFIMKKKEMSVSMVRRAWMISRFVFELAVKKKIISESPVEEDHKVKRDIDGEKKMVLNPTKEYKAVHDSILKVFEKHPKDKALFLLGFMGRRKGEALAMEWGWIDLEEQFYIIPKEYSKIKMDLKFDFDDELKDAFLAIKGDKTEGRLFDRNVGTVTQQALKIRKDTGIKNFTFHYMRNLLVSAMAVEGMTVPELAASLGHKNTATLNQYLTLDRESSSKKALDARKKLLG